MPQFWPPNHGFSEHLDLLVDIGRSTLLNNKLYCLDHFVNKIYTDNSLIFAKRPWENRG